MFMASTFWVPEEIIRLHAMDTIISRTICQLKIVKKYKKDLKRLKIAFKSDFLSYFYSVIQVKRKK